MATAATPTALSPHSEWRRGHASRIDSINNVKAAELAELEAATTRAIVAHDKALKVALAEHTAERLSRIETVVGESRARFRSGWESFIVDHGIGRAEVLAKIWLSREMATRHDLGRTLTNELAVSICELFAEKHPDVNALARFASSENWLRADSGISFFAHKANEALRNPYDVKSIQDSLLELESAIARIATAPGYVTEEADLWPVIAGCWPGDIAEQLRLDHAARAKARALDVQAEETALRVAAARGDHAAREKLAARGAGVLGSVIRNAASILRMTGLSAADADRQAAP